MNEVPKTLHHRQSVHSESDQCVISKREVEELRSRWNDVRAHFVDEPRKAVEDADKLVDSIIKHITEGFHAQCRNLQKEVKPKWRGLDRGSPNFAAKVSDVI